MNYILFTSLKRWATLLLKKEYRIEWLASVLSILLMPLLPYGNLTTFFTQVKRLMRISSNRIGLGDALTEALGEGIYIEHADSFQIPITIRYRAENSNSIVLRFRSEGTSVEQPYLRPRSYLFNMVDFYIKPLSGAFSDAINNAAIRSIVNLYKIAGSVYAIVNGSTISIGEENIEAEDM